MSLPPKADYRNPKFAIGTMFRTTRDIVDTDHYKNGAPRIEAKAGSYFKVKNFWPGVYQPPTGRHSYFMVKCSKNGKEFKYDNGWDQAGLEFGGCDGLFELVT